MRFNALKIGSVKRNAYAKIVRPLSVDSLCFIIVLKSKFVLIVLKAFVALSPFFLLPVLIETERVLSVQSLCEYSLNVMRTFVYNRFLSGTPLPTLIGAAE